MADRTLTVHIVGDSRQLSRTFKGATQDARGFQAQLGRTSTALSRFVKGFAFGGAIGGFGALALAARQGFEEISEGQRVAAQTNAVLKSTGGVAGVTAKQINTLSQSLSRMSGIDDEAIASSQNLLLTFTRIRAQGDIFRDATRSALDMSVALGEDLQTASIRVGKALQDPVRGVTALRRAGVVLSEAQTKVIKRLVETGRAAEAQRIILRELQTEFGGSAQAFGQTLPGALSRARNALDEFAASAIQSVAPSLEAAAQALTRWLSETENQERVQRQFDQALRLVGSALTAFRDVVDAILPALRTFSDIVGGATNAIKLLLAAMLVGRVRAFAGAMGFASASMTSFSVATALASRNLAVFEAAAVLRFGRVGAAASRLLTTLALLRNPILIAVSIEILRGGKDIQEMREGLEDLVSDLRHGRFSEAFGGDPMGLSNLQDDFQRVRDRLDALPPAARRAAKGIEDALARDTTKTARQKIEELERALNRLEARIGQVGRGSLPEARSHLRGADEIDIQVREPRGGGQRIGAELRNRIFDQELARRLDRVQDLQSLRAQITALDQIAGLIQQQIAKVKDVTRQANLRDELLDVRRRQAGLRQQIADDFVSSLELNVDRAGLTQSVNDDLRALAELERAIRAQIATGGRSLDLERQLVSIEQQRASIVAERRAAQREANQQAREALLESLRFRVDRAGVTSALNDDIAALRALEAGLKKQIAAERTNLDLQRELLDVRRQRLELQREQTQRTQFRRLGLTAEGEEPVPGVAGLRKRLGQLRERLRGTPLDTEKNRAQLRRIARVLSGQFGAVGQEVRAAIEQMFDEIASGFENQKKKGPLTKGSVVNTDQILEGLGLSPEQMRAARARLAKVTTSGERGTPARRRADTTGDLRGLGRQAVGVQINGNVTVMADDPDEMRRKLQKKARRRSTQTTGPHAGNATGTTR